jgi:diguanylate cyclase (GGDEF)-like protein
MTTGEAPAAGQPDGVCAEARETAATTTALIVGYVRRHGGAAAVTDLLARAAVPYTTDELEDPARWFSYATRIRLFEAAVEVLDDPDAAFAMGATALDDLPPAIVLLVRALGSPQRVFRQLPSAVTKFSTTSTMEILETGRTHARIRYRLHDGFRHSRLDCRYAQGLISTIPTVFSLPPAEVVHPACESDGHEACLYDVTWNSRPRLSSALRLRRRARDLELRALRGQLEALQSAASDLVGSDELGTTLARITERAAAAVVAPAYLLAVEGPDGAPLVHSAGLDAEVAATSAARLLDDGDLGPNAVVVDVATARRSYGRLAALYGPQQRGMADERTLLAAYAAHAAAALELLLSLESSRRGEARSRDLLELAHRLSVTEDEQDVADVVVAAVPRVVGAPRTSVWRWHAGDGELLTLASAGLTPAEQAVLASFGLRPDETPELARMLTRHEPTVLYRSSSSEPLRQLLTAVGSDVVAAVPLLAGDRLLGVVATDHGPRPPDGWPDPEALARLRGLADQAASALHNARLLSQVRHQAEHDGLTGLPNRVRFLHALERWLEASPDEGGATLAVLFCDLDGFKQINDQLGHAAGDELLRQVAARLRALVRPEDLVARLSGDEFALVVRGRDVDLLADEVADRITDGFSAPFRVEGRELRISTSVGIALRRGEDDADRLLGRADNAMYVAKQRGRNQVAVAGRAPQRTPPRRSSAAELRAGLDERQFELHYQPIVRVGEPGTDEAGVRVVGQEALARWRHPDLGLLAPAAFLPLAEEAGYVVDLDLWAVRTAIRAAATWTGAEPAHVAVNLSAQTLVDRRLSSVVRSALSEAELEPARLTLELIESRSLADLPGVAGQLTDLRHLGVRIALDDFGTGYSTLTWLQRLPIDQVKLDRSFVSGLTAAGEELRLVSGVLSLARALGVSVVAEGVETAEQLSALRSVGCGLAQGYLFARPSPVPVTDLPGVTTAG